MKQLFESKILPLIVIMTISLSVEARELKFLFNSFPPFQEMTEKGPDGPNIRLMRQIVERAGHTAKFEHIPWSRALRMVRLGQVDGMISLYKTMERSKDLVYSDVPLDTNEDRLVSSAKENIPSIDLFPQITKYTVGVLSDNSYGKEFDRLVLKKDFSSTTEDNILVKLLEGRFEVAVISKKPLYHYLRQLKIDKEKVKIHPIVISREGLYFALSKKVPDAQALMSKLNLAHKTILSNVEY